MQRNRTGPKAKRPQKNKKKNNNNPTQPMTMPLKRLVKTPSSMRARFFIQPWLNPGVLYRSEHWEMKIYYDRVISRSALKSKGIGVVKNYVKAKL